MSAQGQINAIAASIGVDAGAVRWLAEYIIRQTPEGHEDLLNDPDWIAVCTEDWRKMQGFSAMGRPVPLERCSHALKHIRSIAPDMDTGDAMKVIGQMSNKIAKDQPYEAMQVGTEHGLDLTGTYRLMAVLARTTATPDTHATATGRTGE